MEFCFKHERKEVPMNKLSLAFSALLVTSVLAGCSTFEGVGKDMEDLGEDIQKEAQ